MKGSVCKNILLDFVAHIYSQKKLQNSLRQLSLYGDPLIKDTVIEDTIRGPQQTFSLFSSHYNGHVENFIIVLTT